VKPVSPFDDPAIPGLRTALDPAAVQTLLRKALPELAGELELASVSIQDVRYQPGGPCWLLYRLKVRTGRGRSSYQLVSAQLLRAGDAPGPLPAEPERRFESCEGKVLRTATAYVPELGIALYAFPIDTALPALFDAVDPNAMRRHLNRLWGPRDLRVREVGVRLLGYTPQARAAFLYEVLAEHKETRLPELRRLIGKVHAKKGAPRLFASAWALWRAAGGKVHLAPPVGYVAAAGLTLQEQLSGVRLGGLAKTPGFTRAVQRTARMLAAMHQLELPLTTKRKPEDEADVVRKWSGVLIGTRPDLAPRVERLRDRLVGELLARTRLSGPVHGDFHHTNVLVEGRDVAIIDLDEMAFGDPMLDVGRFLASLRIPSLRAFGTTAGLARAREVFLSTYLARAPGDEKRVRLFESASLLTTAASSFRIQRPNWAQEIEVLLAEAEGVLEAAGTTRSPSPAPNLPPPVLSSAEKRRSWALDGVYMQATLDPHVRKVYGAELLGCRPVAGAAERIRYRLRGLRRGEKWSACVQGIAWREHGGRGFLQRLEALSSALDGRDDALLLPRPLAYVRPLSLIVWEAPSGTRFASVLGTPEGPAAAARLGRALAALHRAPLALDSKRSLDDELASLRRRVSRLAQVDAGLEASAAALLAKAEAKCRAVAGRSMPVLRTVHPHHIVLCGERVGLSKVEDVTLAHPLLDAGDFLARLALLGIADGKAAATAAAAERFQAAYCQHGPAGADGVAAFEGAALLRLACYQKNEPALAARLLEAAARRLEA
jgi:aminoglycoside phosphotransferase (APT) family kinase protein